jgi:hypothetical protein
MADTKKLVVGVQEIEITGTNAIGQCALPVLCLHIDGKARRDAGHIDGLVFGRWIIDQIVGG